MAKAIIPLAALHELWGLDCRNVRSMNRRTQLEFLRSLRSHH